MLQGDEINLSELKRNSYEEVVFENAARMHLDHDLAIELTAGGRLRTMPLDLRLLDTTHWPTVLEIHSDREIIMIDTWTATASSLIEIKELFPSGLRAAAGNPLELLRPTPWVTVLNIAG